jgi:hypothetical protein
MSAKSQPADTENTQATGIDQSRPFRIASDFKPAGDQPAAIRALCDGLGTGWRT